MSKAGWCQECDEWVWVDDVGACQHGHAPESVAFVHEGTPSSSGPPPDSDTEPSVDEETETPPRFTVKDLRGFGTGDFPDELYRFNWGAFLLPVVWGFAYGAWSLVSLWLVALLLPLLLGGMFMVDGQQLAASAIITTAVVTEIFSGIVRLYAGLAANRLSWQREHRRLTLLPGVEPRFTVARFIHRQRRWAIAGWVLISAGTVAGVVVNAQTWAEYGLSIVGGGSSVIFLVAEVALGWWLAGKMRTQGPDRPVDAADPI